MLKKFEKSSLLFIITVLILSQCSLEGDISEVMSSLMKNEAAGPEVGPTPEEPMPPLPPEPPLPPDPEPPLPPDPEPPLPPDPKDPAPLPPEDKTPFPIPEDRTTFPNPERGWLRITRTEGATQSGLNSIKNANITMVLLESNLNAFLTKPLDSQKLKEISDAFSYARNAGLSVIYRAAYDFSGLSNPEPEDIGIILNHIRQLRPVFISNEDVLFNVQAGFLGPWGEWHTSRYGSKIRPDIQQLVVNEILTAVPKSVSVGVRRPEYVRTITGIKTLSATEAFSGSNASRVSFYNDALLSDSSDDGTYSDSSYSRQAELDWIHNHTRYTPLVGECNTVSDYNDTNTAVELLDYMNLQSLNTDYHTGVINKWRNSSYDGMNAYEYIGMMQGYHFVIQRANLNEAGGSLRLDLEITNTGFGHLLKEKKFELVLKKGSDTYRATIAEDARRWNKNELISRSYYFQLPSDLSSGAWEAYLGLSSTFASLANNPAYSVRFANKDVWDSGSGLNKIGTISLTAAENTGDGKEFRQIYP